MTTPIDDVRAILEAIDFPFGSLPRAWAQRAPKVVLVLGGLAPRQSLTMMVGWSAGASRVIGSRQIIAMMNRDWNEAISSGSYDEVRRRCVRFLVAAGVAMKDPDDPQRAPNSPATGYLLSPEFVRLTSQYGTPGWDAALAEFGSAQGSLRLRLRAERVRHSVPIPLPNGQPLLLSPGRHNQLQAAIITDFLPQFAPKSQVLYVADALSRQLHKDEARLTEIGLFALDHRMLPDVVAWDRARGWLLIIEAVATSGHISPIRKLELTTLLQGCRFPPVFISAFPDYATFGAFADDIAWETEAWIADHPTHMIHFNGERFLGPYSD